MRGLFSVHEHNPLNVSEFDFDLPDDLIAQHPPAVRGGSRLMVVDRSSGRIAHRSFADLPSLLRPGDVLVVNDTRVFPARLIGTRLPGGGAAECFLIRPEPREPDTWIALVHPGQRLREGSRMVFKLVGRHAGATATLHAEIIGRHFHGRRTVRLWTEDGSSGARHHRRDRARAAAAVHQACRCDRRSRSLSDRLRARTRIDCGADGGLALHAGDPRGAARHGASSASASRCMSATARFSRSASTASRSTRWRRSTTKSGSRGRGALIEGEARAPAHHRRRHHDDAHAGIAAALERTASSAPAPGETALFIHAGPRVQDRLGLDHQLPPAAVVAADAGVGVWRAGNDPGGVSGSGRPALSVL